MNTPSPSQASAEALSDAAVIEGLKEARFELPATSKNVNNISAAIDYITALQSHLAVAEGDNVRLLENSLPLGSDPARVKELSAMPVAEFIERLRGVYRIPVTDGLGKVDGSESDDPDVYQRSYATSSIQAAAALVIEQTLARADLASAEAAVVVEALTVLSKTQPSANTSGYVREFAAAALTGRASAAQTWIKARDELEAGLAERNKTLLQANAEFIVLRKRAETAERSLAEARGNILTPGCYEVCTTCSKPVKDFASGCGRHEHANFGTYTHEGPCPIRPKPEALRTAEPGSA